MKAAMHGSVGVHELPSERGEAITLTLGDLSGFIPYLMDKYLSRRFLFLRLWNFFKYEP